MRILIALLLLGLVAPATAQRQWGVNDSTSYAIGGDTVLIASRKVLYRALPGETVILRDFTVDDDEGMYIRDVDHWTSSDWYVLVGSRYIGHPTTLWRTTDGGATWVEDERFMQATEMQSVNQMAITPDGTAYLFNGYYTSEVLFSTDRGTTWVRWFHSLIAHYYGIVPCEGTAFIYGMEGDGFRPALWQVPDSLWGRHDVQFWSGCHNVVPGCHFPPFGLSSYAEIVGHFGALTEGLCLTLPVPPERDVGVPPAIVLEPGGMGFRLVGVAMQDKVEVFDASGRSVQVKRSGDLFTMPVLAAGIYAVVVGSDAGLHRMRFFKP